MQTESRIGAIEWGAALVVAALLHAAAVADFSPVAQSVVGPTSRSLEAPGKGARVRLSLGSPARAAVARPEPAAAAARVAPSRPKALMPPVSEPLVPEPAPTLAAASPAQKPEPSPVVSNALPASQPEPTSASSAASATLQDEATSAGTAETIEPGAPGAALAQSSASDAGDPITLAARQRAHSDYFGGVVAQVRAVLDYPRRARLERTQGTVVLAIRLDRQGGLASCEVAESSGSRLLDRHAVKVARRASPFGRVPAALWEEDAEYELPVDFILTD